MPATPQGPPVAAEQLHPAPQPMSSGAAVRPVPVQTQYSANGTIVGGHAESGSDRAADLAPSDAARTESGQPGYSVLRRSGARTPVDVPLTTSPVMPSPAASGAVQSRSTLLPEFLANKHSCRN